jgi:hypothetical protein
MSHNRGLFILDAIDQPLSFTIRILGTSKLRFGKQSYYFLYSLKKNRPFKADTEDGGYVGKRFIVALGVDPRNSKTGLLSSRNTPDQAGSIFQSLVTLFGPLSKVDPQSHRSFLHIVPD